MKTKLFFLTIIGTLFVTQMQAQNKYQINAMTSESSANLDLRAVATLLGEADNLEDFEMRLNDPNLQLSNLDLNNDNEVDYLRVVESVENRNHLILIQAIIDRDMYQDVATIEVKKNNRNSINIQIIGNRNLYGSNYIYEPIFYSTPILFNLFWNSNYRPYCSNWKWNYYPKHYYSWNPYSGYNSRRHTSIGLNTTNYYTIVNHRNTNQLEKNYHSRRNNHQSNYTYSNREMNDVKRPESMHNKERSNSNTTNRTENRQQNREYGRKYSQNSVLEIREVEIQRNRNQYVDIPSNRQSKKGSLENPKRN